MRLLTILLILNSSFVFAQQTETENKTDERLKVAVGLSAGVHYFNSLNYSISGSSNRVFDVNVPITSAYTANCMLIKPVMPRLSVLADVSLGYKIYKVSFIETIDQYRREIDIRSAMPTFSLLVGPHFQQADANYPFFINCKAGFGSNSRQHEIIIINTSENTDTKEPIWYAQFMTSVGISPSPKTSVEFFFQASLLKEESIFRNSIVVSQFKSNSQVYGIRFSYLLRD